MNEELKQMIDLREIAEKEDLDWIETTTSRTGYPKNLKIALVGFSDFAHAQEVADKYDLDVESFSRRDGWSLWTRGGYKMYEPYHITSETYGDNYRILGKMSEEVFMEEEVLPVIESSNFLFEQLEDFLQEKKEIWEEIENMEDDEIVVTSYGTYYETVKERTLSFYHDTRFFLIGVI